MKILVLASVSALLAGCNTPQIVERDNEQVVTWPSGAVAVLARQRAVEPAPTCFVRARFSLTVLVPIDCDTARMINTR